LAREPVAIEHYFTCPSCDRFSGVDNYAADWLGANALAA
jgi:hypothetical protein